MSFFFNNNYSTIFDSFRFYIPRLTSYIGMLLVAIVALYTDKEASTYPNGTPEG